MTKRKATQAKAWQENLKAISERLQDQDLVSPEQVETLSSLADRFEKIAADDPAIALSLMTTAYSAIEFERLSRQQAEASGTLAWVQSAVPLNDEQRRQVKRRLRERFGQEFVLRMEVDPSLVGGMVIRVQDQIIDGSVAGRLDALGERLRAAAEEQRSPASELDVETDKE
ncbi:MAG: hypothetical protein E3J64_04905 [Anaerolineales bacterium]|nr:MAG: hypothetical protein E3J64_04905 [Anaerolineales bacterium]